MANQFIKERQLNSRGGLANAPQGRSIALSQPDGTKYRNASRLLNDLGMMLPGVMDKQQERADLEAQTLYKKVQLENANKSPEEQRKAFNEAKAGIKTGEGRSFFDKMFVNEDKAVQVWDDLESKTLIRGARAKDKKIREENPFMDEAELKRAIGTMYKEEFTKASTISKRVGDKFLDGTNEYLDNLNLEITNQYAEQRRQQLGGKIITDTNNTLDDQMREVGLTDEQIISSTSDINSYRATTNLTSDEDNQKAIVDRVMPILNGMPAQLNKAGVATGKNAQLKKLDTAVAFGNKYNSIGLLDKLLTQPDKDGMTLQKANPELATEARAKLKDTLDRRQAHFAKMGVDLERSNQLKNTSEVDNYLDGLFQKVEASGGDPEDVKAYNDGIFQMEKDTDEMLTNDPKSAGVVRQRRKVIDTYKNQGRAKLYYDNPTVVSKVDAILRDVRDSESMSYFNEAELDRYGHHMSPEQAIEVANLKRKRLTTEDLYTESSVLRSQEQAKREETEALLKAKNGLTRKAKKLNTYAVTIKGADIWDTPLAYSSFDTIYHRHMDKLSRERTKEPASIEKLKSIKADALEATRLEFATKIEDASLKATKDSSEALDSNRDTPAGKPKDQPKETPEQQKAKASASMIERIDKSADRFADKLRDVGILNEDQVREVFSKNIQPSDIPGGKANYNAFLRRLIETVSDKNEQDRGPQSVSAFGATF